MVWSDKWAENGGCNDAKRVAIQVKLFEIVRYNCYCHWHSNCGLTDRVFFFWVFGLRVLVQMMFVRRLMWQVFDLWQFCVSTSNTRGQKIWIIITYYYYYYVGILFFAKHSVYTIEIRTILTAIKTSLRHFKHWIRSFLIQNISLLFAKIHRFPETEEQIINFRWTLDSLLLSIGQQSHSPHLNLCNCVQQTNLSLRNVSSAISCSRTTHRFSIATYVRVRFVKFAIKEMRIIRQRDPFRYSLGAQPCRFCAKPLFTNSSNVNIWHSYLRIRRRRCSF